MKFFLDNSNYKRIAEVLNKTSMPFLANPPMSQGETYQGILEYPGFHTASTFEVAAAYAVGRILNWSTEEDEQGNHYVNDYPVVVKLNMEGFDPKTDYDAEEMVKPALYESLKQFVDLYNINSDTLDEEIEEAAYEFLEDSSMLEGDYVDWEDAKSHINQVFSYMEEPFGNFMNLSNFTDEVRNFARNKEISQNALMEVTQQFRYSEDVGENKIVAVYYLNPVGASAGVDYGWEGFDIVSQDDFSYGDFNFAYELVYGDGDVDGQYHGTTYHNLLNAAPELKDKLPDPPFPYKG